MSTPEIIQVASAHELLQRIPLLTGFELTQSVVCVAFHRDRSTGAFRLALPTGPNVAHISPAIVGIAARYPREVAFVVVFYGDDERPHLELAQAVARAMHDAGVKVRELLWQSQSSWGSYLDDVVHEYLPLVNAGSSPNRVASSVDVTTKYAVAPEAVRAELRSMRAPDLSVQLVERIESALQPTACAHTVATLVAALEVPSLRDLIVMQWAFGRAVGVEYVQALSRGMRPPRLAALSGSGAEHPQFARAAQVRTTCHRLRALGFDFVHPALWTIEGWMCWAVGESQVAGECFEYALELDHDYVLAQLCNQLVRSGHVPDWVFPVAA